MLDLGSMMTLAGVLEYLGEETIGMRVEEQRTGILYILSWCVRTALTSAETRATLVGDKSMQYSISCSSRDGYLTSARSTPLIRLPGNPSWNSSFIVEASVQHVS